MIRHVTLTSLLLAGVPTLAQTGATPIAELSRGSTATLQGTVERITDDDEFILTDPTGSIEVYLGPNRVPVAVGEAVTVSGFVDDDAGPLELCASSIAKANGTVVAIRNCDD